jgi:hypothetical protein
MASHAHQTWSVRKVSQRGISVLLAVGIMTSLSGCATARYVERHADGGVVAIPENSNHWPTYYRQSALDLITQHVGPHYEILEEREVVVGQQTNNNQQVGPDFLAGITTTRELTEWRIAYRRAASPYYPPATGSPQPRNGSPAAAGSRPTANSSLPGGNPAVQPAGGVPMAPSGSGGVIPSVAPPPAGQTFGTGR